LPSERLEGPVRLGAARTDQPLSWDSVAVWLGLGWPAATSSAGVADRGFRHTG